MVGSVRIFFVLMKGQNFVCHNTQAKLQTIGRGISAQAESATKAVELSKKTSKKQPFSG